jgi:hypothetical protein
MAALSALLTMGLISGLHRYGVDANVQNGEAGTPRPAAPAALMAPATALADTGVRVSHPRVKKAVSKASPVRNQSASAVEVHKRQARGRAHHSSDEDYIAPDTYHYYGNRGSR